MLGEADEATVEAAAAGIRSIFGAGSGREIRLGFESAWIRDCFSPVVFQIPASPSCRGMRHARTRTVIQADALTARSGLVS